ncbi:MAG: sodium:solute symporter [Kangiellaceae bacterium]|nr:sodium:solute symporter [Kangiellaceae bacterium]
MQAELTFLDWSVFAGYFVILAITGWYFSRQKVSSTNDFFLGGKSMPVWLVAISVLATSQSAATFLGGPDQGYRADLSYLATNIGTVLAAVFVAKLMIPKFYQFKVTTVYELLEYRFGNKAKKHAGLMYLFGRVFASGARLYMAAIAVAMILFGNIEASNVVASVLLLAAVGLVYSFVGGIRTVIYSDAIQCAVYVGAAIAVIIYLVSLIPADIDQIINAIDAPLDGSRSKFTLLNFDLDFSSEGVFTVWASMTGFLLLGIASFGMDQDMTQRVLTCKNSAESAKAMLWSVVLVLPVVLVFVSIGLLLYVFYQRPDLMGMQQAGEVAQSFDGEKITIFMTFVLNEMPSGLRGLVTVGIVAAALSTLNSGLNSMSSVVIQDMYRPWAEKRNKDKSEKHFVNAGRIGMLVAALALSAMAILSFYWQRYTDTPLLAFALSVMVFSYSGLLGVYFNALFTKRGNSTSVLLALIGGFMATLFFQGYIQDQLNISWLKFDLAFPYQLCVASLFSFLICFSGKPATESQLAI